MRDRRSTARIIVFDYSQWWPSAILCLLCMYLDDPQKMLGGLFMQNLVGISNVHVVLKICEFQCYASLS